MASDRTTKILSFFGLFILFTIIGFYIYGLFGGSGSISGSIILLVMLILIGTMFFVSLRLGQARLDSESILIVAMIFGGGILFFIYGFPLLDSLGFSVYELLPDNFEVPVKNLGSFIGLK